MANETEVDDASAPKNVMPTIDRTNATGMTVLGDILIATGQVDGEAMTGARLQDKCHLSLTSKDG